MLGSGAPGRMALVGSGLAGSGDTGDVAAVCWSGAMEGKGPSSNFDPAFPKDAKSHQRWERLCLL